jgi:hypothetical protein
MSLYDLYTFLDVIDRLRALNGPYSWANLSFPFVQRVQSVSASLYLFLGEGSTTNPMQQME